MIDTGMTSASGRGPRGTIMLQLLVLVFTALFVARFIYKLDDDEATTFGCLMAIGNLVVNVLLVITVTAAIHLAIARSKNAAKPASLAPSNVNSSVTTKTIAIGIVPTDADREIAHRISHGTLFEGREWKQTTFLRDRDKPISALVDRMYSAGALKVYVDMIGDRTDQQALAADGAAKVYVELLSDQAQRTACVEIAWNYCRANGMNALFATPYTRQFLSIDLRP